MRYLFFDIECSDGVHMCEFGYVITDEHFNVLEKKDILINPEAKFRLTGRPHRKDLKLFYSEEEYYNSPIFTEFYDDIKALIEYKDQLIVGHAIGNDAGFIRTACKRYKLDPINFRFCDSQKMYSEYFNTRNTVSLEDAMDTFNVNLPHYLHKSDDDSELTMQFVKEMISSLNITLEEMLLLCPRATGRSKNFQIVYFGNSLHDKLEMLSRNENLLSNNQKDKCLFDFSKKVQLIHNHKSEQLDGKRICFSKHFEKNNLKDTLVLIQLLANLGCAYNTMVSDNDYYVAEKEEFDLDVVEKNTRYYAATNKEDPNRHVKVIAFDELFKMLGITGDQLEKMPWPTYNNEMEQDVKTPVHKAQRKSRDQYSSGNKKATMADMFVGLDLSEFDND